MQDLDLDKVTEHVRDVYAAAGKLDASADPTTVIGLVVGGLASMTAVYIDMAKSMRRTAEAQEALVAIARLDIEEIINENIEKGVDDAVDKRLSKRSFLGKAPNES